MSGLKFLVLYFVLSATICVLIGLPLFVAINSEFSIGSPARTIILGVLSLSISAGSMTAGFRILNNGIEKRRVSAIVLVFLLSLLGTGAALFAGAIVKVPINWVNNVVFPIDMIFLIGVFGIFGDLNSIYVTSYFPSVATIFVFAVLGAVFGLPLARIARGIRFAEAWKRQVGQRRRLFWRCGLGLLVVSVLWSVISLSAHFIFIEPRLFAPIAVDTDLSPFSFQSIPQPSFFEMSFNFGMQLWLYTLCIGLVAYVTEQARERID